MMVRKIYLRLQKREHDHKQQKNGCRRLRVAGEADKHPASKERYPFRQMVVLDGVQLSGERVNEYDVKSLNS